MLIARVIYYVPYVCIHVLYFDKSQVTVTWMGLFSARLSSDGS